MNDHTNLAIVIPAYKADYLESTLASLAAQSDQNFRVYVCDDHSPNKLEAVSLAFAHRLDLRHHVFNENLGGHALVDQWNRSIRLSDEPWVWLFSDDDTMDPGCVAAWREAALRHPECNLFRFNTRTIDHHGRITRWNPPHPEYETDRLFAYHRLGLNRLSYGCEYIFARRSFDREGGMISFPLAWCSDDASWIAFSRETGIRTISGPMVNWRYGGKNLSVAGATTRAAKQTALQNYMVWLRNRFAGCETDATGPGWDAMVSLLPDWFLHQLLVADGPLSRSTFQDLCHVVGRDDSVTFRDLLTIARHRVKLWRRRMSIHRSR